jgi:hypothetical protein
MRLVVAGFCGLILCFLLLAQRNMFEQVAGGSPPTLTQVLERYHGKPGHSLLHEVLDLDRRLEDPRNMWQYLGGSGRSDPVTIANRKAILDWVEAGATREGYARVETIFTSIESCGACHTAGGERHDLPFDDYDGVLAVATTGGGMPLPRLLISAHNHLFAFAVLGLLMGLGLSLSRLGGLPRLLLIGGLVLGPLLDISAWFLTRSFGSPFHLLVVAGGGLFGLSVTASALIVLRDVARPRKAAGGGAT